MIELAPEIAAHLGHGDAAFNRVFALTGPVFRSVEGRQTLRVQIGGESYFVKRHHGLGWWTWLRTILNFHRPVLSARNEFEAIRRIRRAGLRTVEVVGCGERGNNPATRQSFLLMRELRDCKSLEDLCARWPTEAPTQNFRRELIAAVADVTRTMHSAGINHRDFYLCHLWLKSACLTPTPSAWARTPTALRLNGAADSASTPCDQPNAASITSRLFVIDLHRAMWHRRLPDRWRIKDLAGLLFSAWDCGLSRTDCVRFVRGYRGAIVRNVLADEQSLWTAVIRRAARLYRRTFEREPPVKLSVPKVALRAGFQSASEAVSSPSSLLRAA